MLPFRGFLPLLLTLAISTTSWSATGPKGGLRQDDLADLAPHPQSTRDYNEFWTYQFGLNNGMQAQIDFSRASFGSFKDPVCGADFGLMGFKGHDYFVAREYKIGNFSFDTGRTRLAVHEKIFFEGRPPQKHRVFFSTTKKNVSYFLDLSFDEMSPGAVWGDGVFHLKNGQQMGLFFQIPRARVQGKIAINGDTMAVSGFGWMDHTWQTDFATRLVDAGYRYVVLPRPFNPSGRTEGGLFLRDGSDVFGYGVREEKGRLVLLKPEGIKALNESFWGEVKVPGRLEITFDQTFPVRFQRKEDRQSTSALQELSRMERFGARLFLGGEIYGFRGMGSVNDTLPALYSFTIVKR